MLDLHEATPTCLKCNHTRTAADPGPAYACPKCGAVYAKMQEAARAKRIAEADAADRRREQAEDKAWEKDNAVQLMAMRAEESGHRAIAHVCYFLMVFPMGTFILAPLLAYFTRGSAAGTWVESHFSWVIGTFWGVVIALLLLLVASWVGAGGLFVVLASKGAGSTLLTGGIGVVTLLLAAFAAVVVWFFYRIGKGWLFLFRGDEVA